MAKQFPIEDVVIGNMSDNRTVLGFRRQMGEDEEYESASEQFVADVVEPGWITGKEGVIDSVVLVSLVPACGEQMKMERRYQRPFAGQEETMYRPENESTAF